MEPLVLNTPVDWIFFLLEALGAVSFAVSGTIIAIKKRFGIIPGVTDKSYITNSYHVHVSEEIDAFTKLSFEAQFQALSPGAVYIHGICHSCGDLLFSFFYAVLRCIYR